MIEPRPLTARQTDVLDAIARYNRATGEPCPASYLTRRFDMHHSSIQSHITLLFRKGWLYGPTSPARARKWLSRRRPDYPQTSRVSAEP